MRWPPRLSKLEFCGELQQRVEDVALPETLTHLALLGDFDQPIHAVEWPPALTTVRFGGRFRQPVAAAAWPSSLRTLVLGRGYDVRLLQAGCGYSGNGGAVGCGGTAGPFSPGTKGSQFQDERRRGQDLPLPRSPAGSCCGQDSAASECSRAAGLPACCEVLRACDDVDGDGVAVTAAPEEGEENETGVAAEGRELPASEPRTAEGDVYAAACGVLRLDGSSWNDNDGEEEQEEGLECEDVFGFEDGTWDMGDPWGPGSYASGCDSGGGSSGSSGTVGLSY